MEKLRKPVVATIMEHMPANTRVLLHLTDYRRVPIDPQSVYYLEADGDSTLIRTRSARRLRDVRGLGEVLPAYLPHGLVRVHRSYAVNISRVREIVRRKQGEHWQLRLKPPVGKVLPIGEKYLRALWRAYGD